MNIYSKKITLKYNDIGIANKLNLKSLIKYLQDAAGEHSDLAGYGISNIEKTHLAWLVLNWKVKMLSHPHYNEEITIKTWARSLEKVYSYRDFEILDSNNNLVAIASSKWLLVDSDTKKIKHITEDIVNSYGLNNKAVFNVSLDEKPKVPENNSLNFTYKVQRRDIDTNHHVNNLFYIDFALETIPENIYLSNEFNNIEIFYKKEIKYGEIINCYYSFEDNKHIVTIKSEDNSILHSIITLY